MSAAEFTSISYTKYGTFIFIIMEHSNMEHSGGNIEKKVYGEGNDEILYERDSKTPPIFRLQFPLRRRRTLRRIT